MRQSLYQARKMPRPRVVVHDHSSAFEWLHSARRTARQIIVDGVPWLVYELPPAPFDRRSTPSLVFEAESTVRRVRTYPDDWRTLSDEALSELSWKH
jgi:hypothetical protein